MDEHQAVDSMGPWTIKSVSTKTRETITLAARKEGLTVGQWLDKRVSEWIEDGSPVHVEPAAPSNLADIAQLMEATQRLAQAAGVAVSPGLAKEGLLLLRQAVKQSRAASKPTTLRISAPTT